LSDEDDLQHILVQMTDEQVMQEVSKESVNPEGQFFPDTYYFIKGSTDIALLKRAHRNMKNKVKEVWATRALDLPYQTPNEAVIAASLVEKETALDSERPVIAGVIVNRLRKNMLLQIDPTVIYAAGESYDGTIHKSDLSIKNPYNTYVYKGLPPTPICLPSLASMKAATHPDQNNYYYFVAKNGVGNEHAFSNSLKEHNLAVIKSRKKEFKLSFFNVELLRYYIAKSITLNR
jgi:UPF0755 protein